jgi:hypothetical protein
MRLRRAIVLVAVLLPAMAAAAPAKDSRLDLAFVLLAKPALPGEQEVVKAFATYAPKGPALRPHPGEKSKEALTFALGPGIGAMVGLIPAPVPKGEADEGAQYSVSSLGTGWKLPKHRAHLIVTLSEPAGTPRLDSLSRLTALLAALAQTSGAVGIYWGEAGATHDPKFFMEVARDSEVAARLMLWSGISVAREANGRISLLSLGMKQLDLPDLLLTAPSSGKVGPPLEYFFDLLTYLAKRGKPIPDGDTVGRTADERLKVKYVPSPIDASKKVWRVQLP